MNHLAYKNGQRNALQDLGLQKTALFGFGQPKIPDELALQTRQMYEATLPEAHRGGTWAKGTGGWNYALPAGAAPQHTMTPEMLHALEKKPPSSHGLLGKNPVRNLLIGGAALGGGAMLAKNLLQDPHVDVQPSMPMRTMFP